MSAPANPDSSGPGIDLDDAAAILAYGQEALDDELGKRIAGAITQAPVTALTEVLQQIRQALQVQDPVQLRKSVGWFGRLLGEDIELEARAKQLQTRIGVLLATADERSQALAMHAAELDRLRQALTAAGAKLEAHLQAGRHFLDTHPEAGLRSALPASARDRFRQRLDHLDAVRISQDVSARQLDLVRDQIQSLRVRHGRLRDLLIPVLRQNALAVFQSAAEAEHLLAASPAPGSGSVAAGADASTPDTPPNSTKEQAP